MLVALFTDCPASSKCLEVQQFTVRAYCSGTVTKSVASTLRLQPAEARDGGRYDLGAEALLRQAGIVVSALID